MLKPQTYVITPKPQSLIFPIENLARLPQNRMPESPKNPQSLAGQNFEPDNKGQFFAHGIALPTRDAVIRPDFRYPQSPSKTPDNPLPRTKAHDQDPLYLVNRPTIGSNKSTFNKYSNLNSRKMTGMGWGHVDDLKNIEQPLV